MVDWRLTRNETTVEDNLYDVKVVNTAATFGDYSVAKIDDVDGNRFSEYGRGTRIDLAVSTDGGTSYTDKFTGYVVERRELDQNGADALEIEAYTFDQFLRRNKVSNDQSGNSIAEALEDIITTDTPVSYVSGNVTVGDEQELTRSYRGVPVEQALQDLAFKSNNEEFGVNDSLEFFFRPRETVHIDRGIDNTQWFNYDIPELGKEVINEVEVWFDDSNKSVIVDDGTDKLDLQESLGLPDPGTQRAEINRPKLTDISDAEDEGRKYLDFRNATLSGTVTSFDLFNAQPGDTIDITINSRGIDTEFRIAEVEYRWGVDETRLTVVEKRGDNDDVIFRLTENVDRIEMEDADRDAIKNRVTTTNAEALIDSTATDSSAGEIEQDRLVNDGANLIRDVWTGESTEQITTLVVGDNPDGLSRSNSSLRNQTNSFSVSQSLDDATTVSFTATVNQTISELGLETSSGRLVYRAVIPDGLDASDITVSLSASNDADISRGVVTNDGQTAIRDILADNSPDKPDEYAYGDGTTSPSESDTALANELKRIDLNEVLIQNANSTAEFDSLVSIADDEPLTTSVDSLTLQQSCHTTEAENYDNSSGGIVDPNFTRFSGGSGVSLDTAGEFVEYDFTLQYPIPDGEFEIFLRAESEDSDPADVSYQIDGQEVIQYSPQTTELIHDPLSDKFGWDDPGRLDAGSHTLRVEVTASNADAWFIDVISPADSGDRFGGFGYTLDNDNGGNDGYLDGPELFPDLVTKSFTTASTRRNLTEANFSSTWNDTSNNQFVELANDGSTFTRINNSDSGSVTFGSAESDVDTNIGLSRYGSRTSETPQTGFNGQEIQDWNLFANPDAVVTDGVGTALTRAIIPPNDSAVLGEDLSEAGIFGNGNLLTRIRFAEFTVDSDTRIASAETTEFNDN